ncbi:MAG: S41 family peptidase [Eubacteriales bacterium]|nr:S41 family peptidase [Eubacteriales bacterium]MDD3880717.1 S41 family peptidase [Eubacteriales bacterium]MDD4511649.1 S41 family peptidase [Eubacteriales bacterium]
MKKLLAIILVFAMLLPAAALAEGETVTISKEQYDEYQKYNDLETMYQYIKNYYYIEPDMDAMLEMAKVGLLAGLEDIYSFYYTPEDFTKMWEDDEGDYVGVGLMLLGDPRNSLVLITRAFKDGPAEEAGIKRGDYLLKVDDLDVNYSTLNQAVKIMRGTVGEPVTLTVLREDETLEFTMNRADVSQNLVDERMMDGDIGYIAFYSFDKDSDKELTDSINSMINKGAKGIVIDLRDNGGGWVSDAVSIADLFLDEAVVCTAINRGETVEVLKTQNGKLDIPLVLLVNELSASSSEILSGCLRDNNAATLVGTRTFGKGVMQAVLYVGTEGAGFQFTMEEYLTPNGDKVHEIGILPDVICEYTDEHKKIVYEFADENDPQVKCALETMRQILDGTFVKPDNSEYIAREEAAKALAEGETEAPAETAAPETTEEPKDGAKLVSPDGAAKAVTLFPLA